MNIEWFIARRLLKGDTEKSVSVPIVRIAIGGIALGLCVMLLSIFIIIGFKHEITWKLSGFTSHLNIIPYETSNGAILQADSLMARLKRMDGVNEVYGYIEKPAILKSKSEIHGVVLKGVDSTYNRNFFQRNLKEGKMPDFSTPKASEEILISAFVADYLNVNTGDKIIAHFVQEPPRVRAFRVSGIYDTGFKEYDDVAVLADRRHLARLNGWEPGQLGGIAVELSDVEKVNEYWDRVDDLLYDMNENCEVKTLGDIAPQIFDWLNLLNMNVWIILILIVTVAGFNMVSGLLILILDKTVLIGMLKALGCKNISLRRLFLYISAGLIVKGMIWGNLLAFLLAGIQYYFKVVKLDPVTYYMSTVPIYFNGWYILFLNVGVIAVTLLMLIVPTMLISKINPIKSIRFE
ncbi:FtsX-like permease family protein [uncultured Sanguibacteroides sp.]|uniref:ABC transporter permease n=1 Tax=uncultured Sanguibacteroides sp. TaxID=1635151 RepID=UPI0025E10755|nr:FtsX-like permease family protein [uncultured Sanguibacteroides sp.]